MTLGITSSIAPDTPDLAGKPTWEMRARGWMWDLFQVNKWTSVSFTAMSKRSRWTLIHLLAHYLCCVRGLVRWYSHFLALLTWKAIWPEKSYMPHECMRLKVFRTASALRTRSPVIGQIPPLARVAAMILPDSQVTSMEQSWDQKRIGSWSKVLKLYPLQINQYQAQEHKNSKRLFNDALWLVEHFTWK